MVFMMDSKLILKDFEAKIEVKAPSEENPSRDIAVIITVQEEDRDGDIIDVKGIKTDSYLKNPVVLWNHDHGIPIAKNISLSMVDGNMIATARFPEKGISDKADEIYGLIKAGILNAASIGFMPNYDEMVERKSENSPWGSGYQFKEVELLEYSFVSVPSNRSALIQQRSFLADHAKPKKEAPVSEKAPPPETKPKRKEEPKMNDLIELRAKRADLLEQVEKHLSEFDVTDLPETIADEVDALQAEMTTVDKAINRLEQLESFKAARTVASPEKALRDPVGRAGHIEVSGKSWLRGDDKPEAGIRFAQLARAYAAGNKSKDEAVQWSKSAYGESHPVTLHLQKTLNQTTTTAGGFTVPEDWGSDFIELLRNFTVVRQCGPQSPGMPNGNLTLPGLTSGASSGYIGENTSINASDAVFREIKLAAKKIASVTSMSNELLQYNAYGADMIVRDDLVEGMAVAEDAQLLRGTGSATAPTSFLEIATSASNNIAAPATSTLADFDTGLTNLELVLMNNNVNTVGACWIMAPRTYQTLSNARDGNGNKAYPEMTNWNSDNTAMLRGKRVLISNQVPVNLGTGTDESEIYLVQGRHIILADTRRMQMMTTQHGNFSADGSTYISTFSNDLTAFRLISEHDMNARHVACVAVLDTVVW